jgi:polysaccharide export outer membrane protein
MAFAALNSDSQLKIMHSRRNFDPSFLRLILVLFTGSVALLCSLAIAEPDKAAAGPGTAKPNSDAAAPIPPPGFRIGPGDVLQISVLKEPDASVPAVVVRSDGIISLPLLKEVPVVGLSPRELEQLLTRKFSEVIRDPDVTVLIKEIHSEKVYVIGAVRKEGPILLQTPLTVLQAVAEAGGLTDYAKRNRIYILRLDNSRQVRIPFDYQSVIKGERTDQNIALRPGDTVVVPQ